MGIADIYAPSVVDKIRLQGHIYQQCHLDYETIQGNILLHLHWQILLRIYVDN